MNFPWLLIQHVHLRSVYAGFFNGVEGLPAELLEYHAPSSPRWNLSRSPRVKYPAALGMLPTFDKSLHTAFRFFGR